MKSSITYAHHTVWNGHRCQIPTPHECITTNHFDTFWDDNRFKITTPIKCVVINCFHSILDSLIFYRSRNTNRSTILVISTYH